MQSATKILLIMLATAAGTPMAAPLATHLTLDNFVQAGDAIVELFDTRMLALANLVMIRPDLAPTAHRLLIEAPPQPLSAAYRAICPAGGSVTGTITDADADDDISPGDRITANFHLCRMTLAGEVYTGSSEVQVSRHTVDEAAEETEFRYRFDGLGTEVLRWSGTAIVSMREVRPTGGDHLVVDYLGLAVERWALPCRWDFSLDIWRSPLGLRTASLEGQVMLGTMQLRIDQPDPFVFTRDRAAQAGRLTAMDSAGNLLQIEAGDLGYRYSWRARATDDTLDARLPVDAALAPLSR